MSVGCLAEGCRGWRYPAVLTTCKGRQHCDLIEIADSTHSICQQHISDCHSWDRNFGQLQQQQRKRQQGQTNASWDMEEFLEHVLSTDKEMGSERRATATGYSVTSEQENTNYLCSTR